MQPETRTTLAMSGRGSLADPTDFGTPDHAGRRAVGLGRHAPVGQWLLLLCVWAFLVAGCGTQALAPISQPADRQTETRQTVARQAAARQTAPKRKPRARASRPATHTVRRGDTLYSIAWRYGLDYREIARWNKIAPPYLIHAGRRLVLRAPAPRAAAARRTQAKPVVSTAPLRVPKPLAEPASSRETQMTRAPAQAAPASRATASSRSASVLPPPVPPKPRAEGNKALQWAWPTQGNVVATFSATEAGKKGLDITGRFGQPVRAAALGEVVYSGSGLMGYGKLVIVKHNKDYLSAYGHNRSLLVKEGDWVQKSQRIAEMGRGRENQALLHFEIRRNGKPVDPMRYLPKR